MESENPGVADGTEPAVESNEHDYAHTADTTEPDAGGTLQPPETPQLELPEPVLGAEVDCPGGTEPNPHTEDEPAVSCAEAVPRGGSRRSRRPEDRNCCCCRLLFQRQGRSLNRRAVFTFTTPDTVRWVFPDSEVHEKSFLCETCAQIIRTKGKRKQSGKRSLWVKPPEVRKAKVSPAPGRRMGKKSKAALLVSKSSYKAALQMLWSSKGARKPMLEFWSKQLRTEMKVLARRTDSPFQQKVSDRKPLSSFPWRHCLSWAQQNAPLVTACLRAMFPDINTLYRSSHSQLTEDQAIMLLERRAVVALAIPLFTRNIWRNNFLQAALGAELRLQGCTGSVLDALNTMGLCQNKDTVRLLVHRLCNGKDLDGDPGLILKHEQLKDEMEEETTDEEEEEEQQEEEDEEEDASVLSSLDNYQLCLKYQQLQSKLRSRTAQLRRAKEKLKAWEEQRARWQSLRAELEQRAQDGEEKAEKLENYWQEAQTLCRVVSQRLADTQGQTESLEIKYSKAKRLVRDYQSREEEMDKKLADMTNDMEEREKQHRETVERLQTQIAQLGGKEPELEKRNHTVDPSVTDWYLPVPNTGRLDSSAHIARAQLAQKSKRNPPSRDKLRESFKKQQEEVVVKPQESLPLSTSTVVQSNRSDRSSTSTSSALSPQPTSTPLSAPPVYICDSVTSSPRKSSASRKSRRIFPNLSGIRKSLGKKRSEKCSRRSANSSGSCGDLIDEPPDVPPSGLFTSVPSCLHLPWFGDRGKEKEEVEQHRPRLRSVSSSSLPYLTTADRRDQTLDDYPVPNNNNNRWQCQPVSEWNNQQVCLWLISMSMNRYTKEFTAREVDGTQLLNMDSQKLKALGVSSQNDRSVLKKKLKEMRREDKDQRKEDKKPKEGEGGERARMPSDTSVNDVGGCGKTVRTESLL